MEGRRALGSGYALHEILGRGASGEVWRGSDHVGRPYAVKLLHPHLTENRSVVDRFVQERAVLGGIHHPHVVRVHDLVAEGSTLGLVMELVEGPDLRSVLRSEGTLPPETVARLGSHVAAGLAAAHDVGVVHRDVKPENILLRVEPTRAALLSDFGVARLLSEAQGGRTILGTPQYFAPETVDGTPPQTTSDLYALGVTMYELCCGVTPFAGRTDTAQVLQGHLDENPGRPPGVPDDLWAAIERLVTKTPGERPEARAVAVYLDALAPRLTGVPAAPTCATSPATTRAIPRPAPALPAPDAYSGPVFRAPATTGAYIAFGTPPVEAQRNTGMRVFLLVCLFVALASGALVLWSMTREGPSARAEVRIPFTPITIVAPAEPLDGAASA